jgi:hypothetical protein
MLSQTFLIDIEELRGSPPKKPDVVADYTESCIQAVAILAKVNTLQERFKICYGYLFVTVALGLLAFLIAITFESSRSYVSLACYVLIVSQFWVVLLLRRYGRRLENHEDNAQA